MSNCGAATGNAEGKVKRILFEQSAEIAKQGEDNYE